MRRTLVLGGVVLGALLLQSTVFSQLKLAGAKPELMYIITIVLAILEGPTTGAVVGFAAGMSQDFLLNQPKGITALVLTVVGWVVGSLRQYLVAPSSVIPVVVVAAATFGGILFYGLVAFLLGQLGAGFLYLLKISFLTALYNAILTPLAYPLLRRAAEASRTKSAFRW